MYHGAQSINLFPHVIGKVVRLSKRVTHSIRAKRYAEKAFFKEKFFTKFCLKVRMPDG